ncbi:MAG: hypothetical protein DI529_06550 [Chryseobacterium sp.]|nr:MAG: hypothetical protein DI529_06550 [Chryseobacterium sp.]
MGNPLAKAFAATRVGLSVTNLTKWFGEANLFLQKRISTTIPIAAAQERKFQNKLKIARAFVILKKSKQPGLLRNDKLYFLNP